MRQNPFAQPRYQNAKGDTNSPNNDKQSKGKIEPIAAPVFQLKKTVSTTEEGSIWARLEPTAPKLGNQAAQNKTSTADDASAQ